MHKKRSNEVYRFICLNISYLEDLFGENKRGTSSQRLTGGDSKNLIIIYLECHAMYKKLSQGNDRLADRKQS